MALFKEGSVLRNIGDFIRDTIGAVTGTAQIGIEEQNLAMEQGHLNYQKDLQEEIFEREDTAYQRKAADLQAAGMSPILAAGGSGSPAGQVLSTRAPQQETKGYDQRAQMANLVMQMILAKADVSKTQAQTGLIKSQTQTETNRREMMGAQTEGHTLANTLANATLQNKIAQTAANLTGTNLANRINAVKAEVAENTITQQVQQQIANLLTTQTGIDQRQQQLLAGEIAIAANRITNYKNLRDLAWLSQMGLPSFIKLESIAGLTLALANQASTSMQAQLTIAQELLQRYIVGGQEWTEIERLGIHAGDDPKKLLNTRP